ncbi:NAD(P)/FAD-dependent oxidoreductase [Pseudohalioglobus sediminis]|uniref:NAD(P)/FAD-dependent oxidoreductase n=1 Tax=Pseudohalioglobus sediminis TaxID=2606449 RepID=A0A5B0WZE0_9GAMM|nr:NAD(P)/FAD-dependent oxidoreductase [Pseudohalioglobus sediminis]KAA1192376.1 NAD(P)/FAD-dependent oxidoreductase [Pseudohalioglobus sediminis]
MTAQQKPDFDSIVIGAGFAGLALIHYLREAGQSVRVFDKASDIGGTWTWNRYPGAMTDSESYYYCLTFSRELLQEWSWTRRYPDWEETHRYMHFVADKIDAWPSIQLETEVVSADYQNDTGLWLVTTGDGKTHTCKYFISGMGMISEPVIPKIKGMDTFKGPLFHSSRWPQEGLDYAGKRVGIIGAGATTVQMTPVMAETAESVTVFQRTPNFILPAMQKPMTPEWEADIKSHYDDIVAKCRNHVFGMAFDSPVGRNYADTAPEDAQRIFEENWTGSFRWVFETFDDLLSNPDANKAASQFIIDKMKERIDDPEIAELLTPSTDDYPLFAKRPPLDHGYLESFNRDNVHLVDIKDREPIVEITETGVRTTENDYEFDIIVLATGFRAYTGALEAFPIRGKSGQSLAEKWQETSNSIMGVCVADFPNLFIITGPQAPFANLPTSIEQNAMWIADCIKKMEGDGYDLFEPRQDAEDEWSAHVSEVHEQTLMAEGDKVNSWMMGANIENHKPRVLIYFGGANVYYDKLRESVNDGFPELEFRRLAG